MKKVCKKNYDIYERKKICRQFGFYRITILNYFRAKRTISTMSQLKIKLSILKVDSTTKGIVSKKNYIENTLSSDVYQANIQLNKAFRMWAK